jgi:alanine racemase
VPIVVLQGFCSLAELAEMVAADLWPVIHAPHQFEILQAAGQALPTCLWLKLETGMNRLGLAPEDFAAIWRGVDALPGLREVVVISHLAAADDREGSQVRSQLMRLQAGLSPLGGGMSKPWCVSFSASGGILAWPECHFDWLRPGIMLYGGAAVQQETGEQRGLRPVMTLRSRVIAVKTVPAGESIGYGATYRCEQEQQVAIVSIGYGDGYPRHAPTGTPVILESAAGPLPSRTLGRVSMDMLAVDVSHGVAPVQPGDSVILWGGGVSADEVAERSGTIAYELFCRLTGRVERHYLDSERER